MNAAPLDAIEVGRRVAPVLFALSGKLFGGEKNGPLPKMFQGVLRRSLEGPEAVISRSELMALAGNNGETSGKLKPRDLQKRIRANNKNFTWRLRVLRQTLAAMGPLPPEGLFFRWQSFRKGRNRTYRVDFGFQRGAAEDEAISPVIARPAQFRWRDAGSTDEPSSLNADVLGHCRHKKEFSITLQKLDVDWGSFLGIGEDQMRAYKNSRDQFWTPYAGRIRETGRLAWNGRLWGLCRHSVTQMANGRILTINLSVTRIRQADVIFCRKKHEEEIEWAKKKTRLSLGEWLMQRRLEFREAIPPLSPICLGVLLLTAERHVVITQQGGTKNRAQQWSLTGRGALDTVYSPEEESVPDLSLLVQRKVAEEVGIPVSVKWIKHLGFVRLEEDGHTNNMILVAVATNYGKSYVKEFIEERKFRGFISNYDILPLETIERDLQDKGRFPGEVDESLTLALALNGVGEGRFEVVES